jgi:hypothetical protein
MANCSIPNSTPATGRTSALLSRRSRRSGKLTGFYFFLPEPCRLTLRKARQAAALQSTLRARKIQPAILDQQSSIWRVKGAWWSSRSSKPLSVPYTRDRGRFDSYPLRLKFSRHPERSVAESKDPAALSRCNSAGLLDLGRNDENSEGGEHHVA